MCHIGILVLIGLPAAGKSSFAKHLCDFSQNATAGSVSVTKNLDAESKEGDSACTGNGKTDQSLLNRRSHSTIPGGCIKHRFHRVSYDDVLPGDSFQSGDNTDTTIESTVSRYDYEKVQCISL